MILVFGIGGQVGEAVLQRLSRRGAGFAAPTVADADLSKPESLRDVVRGLRPSAVVNAAAYTAVDRAESEPELARLINAVAPGVIAEEAARLGIPLIHYSTDYVFDGTATEPLDETADPNPLSVYGSSKLEGERAVAAAGGRHVILRTSWVYGPIGGNFLLTMRRLFREREEVRVVNDQFGAPTSASFLAEATLAVLDSAPVAPSGIYHATAAGQTTWFGFAERIHKVLSGREALRCRRVLPIATAEYPTPARRPRWSVLDTTRFQRTFGVTPPSWEEQLDEVVQRLYAGAEAPRLRQPADHDSDRDARAPLLDEWLQRPEAL